MTLPQYLGAPEGWVKSPIGWLRVDGMHVIVSRRCSIAWTPVGELVAWWADFWGRPGREDALILCDLVDELIPVDPRALVRVDRLEVARA